MLNSTAEGCRFPNFSEGYVVLLATGGPLLPAFKDMPVLAVRVSVGDNWIW
jgi:hypothetical protein